MVALGTARWRGRKRGGVCSGQVVAKQQLMVVVVVDERPAPAIPTTTLPTLPTPLPQPHAPACYARAKSCRLLLFSCPVIRVIMAGALPSHRGRYNGGGKGMWIRLPLPGESGGHGGIVQLVSSCSSGALSQFKVVFILLIHTVMHVYW